jgi:hypothetical protein
LSEGLSFLKFLKNEVWRWYLLIECSQRRV